MLNMIAKDFLLIFIIIFFTPPLVPCLPTTYLSSKEARRSITQHHTTTTMVQLRKPSSFLSIAAVVALSLPASSNAQEFMTCILTGMGSGDFDLQAPLTELVPVIEQKCCPEGNTEPTCTAFKCVDLETMLMNEPCTCGEVETAQKGMLEDPTIAGSISMMLPTFAEDTQAAFDACCSTESTTASEFNTCFAALQAAAPAPAPATTTATTAASTNVDDGSTSTESTPAADTTTTTTTGATEAVTTTTAAASTGAAPAPSPSPAPSSANSITSVSFNIILAAYALFNYVM
jgi:hypothetical protein